MSQTTIIGRPVLQGSDQGSDQGGAKSPQWLITFADLAAVLVAFFVLMFSMSEVDTDRWNGAVDALDRQFDVSHEAENARPTAQLNIRQLLSEDGLELGYLRRILAGHIADQPELSGAGLREVDDSVIVTLPASFLFEKGGARVSTRGQRSIFILAGALGRIDNNIEVIGHADPQLIKGRAFDTNWELSLARAAAVARALSVNGVSREIRIVGAGASRFDEIDPDLPLERREALARRVDIVVRDRLGALR